MINPNADLTAVKGELEQARNLLAADASPQADRYALSHLAAALTSLLDNLEYTPEQADSIRLAETLEEGALRAAASGL